MNKELIKKLFTIFHRLDVPFLLIGGYAAAIWGHVRATKDIDFLVDIPIMKVQKTVEELKKSGFDVDYSIGDIGDPVSGIIRLTSLVDGIKETVELLLGIKKMPKDIYSRVEKIYLGELGIPVVSPEDFIVLKLLAGGPVDRHDVRSIYKIMKKTLDSNYLERELQRCKLDFDFN